MGFHDVAFLPAEPVFPPHFLHIVVEVKDSGPSHVLKLCSKVSKGMLWLVVSKVCCGWGYIRTCCGWW